MKNSSFPKFAWSYSLFFCCRGVIAGNWNKNSDSKRVDDDQYAQIDKAGKGIQWRLRPTSLISRAEQIIFVPDPLGSDDQVIQFEVSDGDCGENKQPDGSKWSDCDGGKDRAEINNRLPERGEVWYRWEIFSRKIILVFSPPRTSIANINSSVKRTKKRTLGNICFLRRLSMACSFVDKS